MRVVETSAPTLTGNEPSVLTTRELPTIPMMSLEEDLYQLHDVQRKFGGQDQEAPIVEEAKELLTVMHQFMCAHSNTAKGTAFANRVKGDQCREQKRNSAE